MDPLKTAEGTGGAPTCFYLRCAYWDKIQIKSQRKRETEKKEREEKKRERELNRIFFRKVASCAQKPNLDASMFPHFIISLSLYEDLLSLATSMH
jgi:hypothetical protein